MTDRQPEPHGSRSPLSAGGRTVARMAIARFASFVLDCPDPGALAEFYGGLLDWKADVDQGWAEVHSDDGRSIAFQQVEGYTAPDWPGQQTPQQVHLDVEVDDLARGGPTSPPPRPPPPPCSTPPPPPRQPCSSSARPSTRTSPARRSGSFSTRPGIRSVSARTDRLIVASCTSAAGTAEVQDAASGGAGGRVFAGNLSARTHTVLSCPPLPRRHRRRPGHRRCVGGGRARPRDCHARSG